LLSEYASVLDMTEDYFLETLRVIFQEQQLAHGTWEVRGQLVQGDALASTALCTVEGDCDDITGAGQTHAAHTVCRAAPERLRVQLTVPDCSHYDLFTGPRWREVVHPALVAFWHDARKQSEVSPS
jgi:polyhydroxyalkanoate depolymerase